MSRLDESLIKNQVDTILIHSDSCLQIDLKKAEYFELPPKHTP